MQTPDLTVLVVGFLDLFASENSNLVRQSFNLLLVLLDRHLLRHDLRLEAFTFLLELHFQVRRLGLCLGFREGVVSRFLYRILAFHFLHLGLVACPHSIDFLLVLALHRDELLLQVTKSGQILELVEVLAVPGVSLKLLDLLLVHILTGLGLNDLALQLHQLLIALVLQVLQVQLFLMQTLF
jgi:hypothetical protein